MLILVFKGKKKEKNLISWLHIFPVKIKCKTNAHKKRKKKVLLTIHFLSLKKTTHKIHNTLLYNIDFSVKFVL